MTIHYQNDVWVIDDEGMDTLDESYYITKGRLLEGYENHGQYMYSWPLHMASKTWVDIDVFLDAWLRAIDFHKDSISRSLSAVSLAFSIQEAQKYLEAKDDPENKKFWDEMLSNINITE